MNLSDISYLLSWLLFFLPWEKNRHLRAGWMAQELLLTFGNTIGELALIPGKSATFIVRVNGGKQPHFTERNTTYYCRSKVSRRSWYEKILGLNHFHLVDFSLLDVVFDRKDHGRFPEMKEVKQLVRTVIAPEMGLGHSDSKVKSAESAVVTPAGASEAAQGHEETKKAEAVTATPAPATSGAAVTAQVDEDDEDSTVHDKECKTCL